MKSVSFMTILLLAVIVVLVMGLRYMMPKTPTMDIKFVPTRDGYDVHYRGQKSTHAKKRIPEKPATPDPVPKGKL
jgi:hypothetical protein